MVRRLYGAGVGLALLVALLAVAWVVYEHELDRPSAAETADPFRFGALGLELAPLKFVLVMGRADVSARQFGAPAGQDIDWRAEFGFITKKSDPAPKACQETADAWLPEGMIWTHLLPSSASPVPTRFAAMTCSVCHSQQLVTADGRERTPTYGAGSAALDLLRWQARFENAILDPELSVERILDAYDKQCGPAQGVRARARSLADRFFIGRWLGGIRKALTENASKYDLPRSAVEGGDETGPARTRPFRSVVRTVLDVPAEGNHALSKVPAAFEQNTKQRPGSQYDGSIADPLVRALIAANTSSASVEALAKPRVVHNLKALTRMTETLGVGPGTSPGPAGSVRTFAQMFPDEAYRIDPAKAERGLAVYRQHCGGCHGYRPLGSGAEPAAWSFEGADHIHKVAPLEAIGTDPARIEFRYADMLPDAIYLTFVQDARGLPAQRMVARSDQDAAEKRGEGAVANAWQRLDDNLDQARRQFPAGHPLRFGHDVLSYNHGYVNNPIPLTYLRAPYLHNGSVPTLGQLIGLEPRPAYFCRGANLYDPKRVGLVGESWTQETWRAPGAARSCPAARPYLFDTTRPGNSNAGHYFPPPGTVGTADLDDLLEYLKTL